MRNLITSIFLVFLCLSIHAQKTSSVNIGIGRYTFEQFPDISQYALNVSMSQQLNKTFALRLNASIYNEGETTYTKVVSDFPPFETITRTDKFAGYSATLNLDIFALGLANNKFQTHIGLGGGIMDQEDYYLLGFLTGYIEEQVVLPNNNTLAVGFSFSQELEAGFNLKQFYFNVGKRF